MDWVGNQEHRLKKKYCTVLSISRG